MSAAPQLSSSLMWIGAILAGIRRKQAIGGWLFFFFWQVAVGCAVSVVGADWPRYAPGAWHDQFQYLIFMMVTMPRMAVLLVIAAIGAILIRTLDWKWVVVLRYGLILYTALGLASIAADALYFSDRLTVDVSTLIFPVAFTAYFYVSSRVKSVFADHTWQDPR